MLEPKVSDVIAKTQQEVIVAIMMCPEHLVRLLHQVLVVIPNFLRCLKRSRTVGGNVHLG